MAQRVELEVTVPVHGPGGEVAYQPGHRFASLDEVPDGVPVRPVVAEAPDEEPASEEPPAGEAPAGRATGPKAHAARPAARDGSGPG